MDGGRGTEEVGLKVLTIHSLFFHLLSSSFIFLYSLIIFLNNKTIQLADNSRGLRAAASETLQGIRV